MEIYLGFSLHSKMIVFRKSKKSKYQFKQRQQKTVSSGVESPAATNQKKKTEKKINEKLKQTEIREDNQDVVHYAKAIIAGVCLEIANSFEHRTVQWH